jgi:hypothetical protein
MYTEQVGYLVNPVRFSLVLYMDALVVVMNDLETLWYVGALGWSAWLEQAIAWSKRLEQAVGEKKFFPRHPLTVRRRGRKRAGRSKCWK